MWFSVKLFRFCFFSCFRVMLLFPNVGVIHAAGVSAVRSSSVWRRRRWWLFKDMPRISGSHWASMTHDWLVVWNTSDHLWNNGVIYGISMVSIYIPGWWFGTLFVFPFSWESYSKLTNMFQKGWNHQPVWNEDDTSNHDKDHRDTNISI